MRPWQQMQTNKHLTKDTRINCPHQCRSHCRRVEYNYTQQDLRTVRLTKLQLFQALNMFRFVSLSLSLSLLQDLRLNLGLLKYINIFFFILLSQCGTQYSQVHSQQFECTV